MSPHTNFHAPRQSLSGRIQIGHKSGCGGYVNCLFSVNIKPPRHRFGFSLAWGWQLLREVRFKMGVSSLVGAADSNLDIFILEWWGMTCGTGSHFHWHKPTNHSALRTPLQRAVIN